MNESEIPEAFQTARLILRPAQPEDAASVHSAIAESLVRLRPWMAWADGHQTIDGTREFIRRAAEDRRQRRDLNLCLFERASGACIGASGLHRIDWSVPRFEIGYWCRSSAEGRGYITEAVHAITAYAFELLKANRTEIHMDARNQRSRRVAERTGYTLEGELRCHRRAIDGSLENTLVFSMIESEFRMLRSAQPDLFRYQAI